MGSTRANRAHRQWVAALVAGVALGVVALAAHAAKVYKWTDKNGVTHYGDHVPDGASAAVKSGSLQVIPVTV